MSFLLSVSFGYESREELTVIAVQLEIDELQPLQAGQTLQQVLHVLQDHPTRPVDVDLVVLSEMDPSEFLILCQVWIFEMCEILYLNHIFTKRN